MSDDDWAAIKNIPGMTGDEEFDEEMRKFRAKYHREDREIEDDLGPDLRGVRFADDDELDDSWPDE